MGITGTAKTELRPKQKTAKQTFLTMLIRMLTRYAQRGAVDRQERKQRLATRQGELSFKVFEVKSMIFHYKLSHKCHSERSEEPRINFRPILPRANEQRCFASLLMNTADRCAWWNIGLWPVCPVPKTFGILRRLPISGLQTRWAHRLEVYVPLTRAYRRKHPTFIPAPKITPTCWKTST